MLSLATRWFASVRSDFVFARGIDEARGGVANRNELGANLVRTGLKWCI